MHELYCPNCNTASQYFFGDYLLMCPFCSGTFKVDLETGNKELYGDHYIVPNTIDAATVKELALEWLRRLHHKPNQVDQEFFVTDIQGMSIPIWIVSMEAHTTWKGLVQKKNLGFTSGAGSDYLVEKGQFRRSYRWGIIARSNICETWGLTRLHQPPEGVQVEWDGFPFDSTLSRGKLSDPDPSLKSAYDVRKYFEFKFSNGLPILGIQVPEEEALRRARAHVELYHYKMSSLNTDYLLDHRSELEIAGIQLLHVPIWKVTYVYRPKTALRFFTKPRERKILIDGYGKSLLEGEIAMTYTDKVMINAVVCGIATMFFFLFGMVWHPAFYIVGAFSLLVASASLFLSLSRKAKRDEESLLELSSVFNKPATAPTAAKATAR